MPSFSTALELKSQATIDVLVVDISTVAGNDLDLTCISLLEEFTALNHGSGDTDNKCRAVM